MSRRRRCTGPCGDLYPPDKLARVSGRDLLCPDCLILEANAIAPLPADLAQAADLEARKPEPLPLRDEEERFDGLVEVDVPGWPLRRGRLSASALATYMRCPEQFRREKVLGQRSPTGGSAVIGTGAHGAIEAALRFQIEEGVPARPAVILDTFDAVYEAAVYREQERGSLVWGNAEKKPLDFDRGRRLGRGAVEAYIASDAYLALKPVALEHVFAFTVPGVPVPFCGLIDVLESHATVDLKFGDQCVSQIRPDWRVASLVYGFATRTPPVFHSVSWAGKVQGPVEAPALRVPWDARTAVIAARTMRHVVGAILRDARDYGPHEPWLGNVTHTWACSTCAFRPECAWWNVQDEELLL